MTQNNGTIKNTYFIGKKDFLLSAISISAIIITYSRFLITNITLVILCWSNEIGADEVTVSYTIENSNNIDFKVGKWQ